MASVTMLEEAKLVTVARGVAMDIFPLEQILASAGVSWDQFNHFKDNPRFIGLVEQFAVEWGSAMNTAMRIKVKTQAMIEDLLPNFYSRMADKKEPFAAQVDALKTLRLMGGVGGEESAPGPAEKFRLEIHIGDAAPVTLASKGFGDDVIEHASLTPSVKEPVSRETTSLNFELGGGIEDSGDE